MALSNSSWYFIQWQIQFSSYKRFSIPEKILGLIWHSEVSECPTTILCQREDSAVRPGCLQSTVSYFLYFCPSRSDDVRGKNWTSGSNGQATITLGNWLNNEIFISPPSHESNWLYFPNRNFNTLKGKAMWWNWFYSKFWSLGQHSTVEGDKQKVKVLSLDWTCLTNKDCRYKGDRSCN